MAGFFDIMFGGGAEKEARDANQKVLQQYQGQSLGALKDAYDQSVGYGTSAVGAYAPVTALGQKYGGATDLQLDALGVNGPAGTARARTAMAATPGYDLGIEAVNRRRSLAGMGDSGGTDTALADYVTKDVYAPWLSNVTNAAQMGGNLLTAGASGTAAGYGKLADLSSLYGQNQTNVYGNVASGNIAANNQAAAGEAAGAKNLLGAGLSLATLAAGGNPFGGSLMGAGGGTSGGAWSASPMMKFAKGVQNIFST